MDFAVQNRRARGYARTVAFPDALEGTKQVPCGAGAPPRGAT
jgi:hypothetical protein